MRDVDRAVDWAAWLRRWDEQQPGYDPAREARFGVMLDVLEGLLPADFVAVSPAEAARQSVDLGCGPGALARRPLERSLC